MIWVVAQKSPLEVPKMGTDRRISYLSVSLLLNLLLLFTTSTIISAKSSSSSSIISVGDQKEVEGAEKVTVALYYETLCPYCSNLIVNYLYKIFDDGLYDIVDFKLIPYGNAKIRNNTIVCQVLFFSLTFLTFSNILLDSVNLRFWLDFSCLWIKFRSI